MFCLYYSLVSGVSSN